MEELIGKSINNIYVNSDKTRIVFQCWNRFICYDVLGDCCSTSWIEHISGLPKEDHYYNLDAWLFSFRVDDITSLECRNIEVPDREFVEIFGYRLIGPKGEITIEMRNESNGYYSGYIDCNPEIHSKLNTLGSDFIKVIGDF